MRKLLSLPPNIVGCFHQVTGLSPEEYFCTCDPPGHRLGSGGGATWLLQECHRSEGTNLDFDQWLATDKRILIHAGGQSRRLPAYAPSSKALTPIPVFRWERGQRLSQTLLDLQVPLCERIMENAPATSRTMIFSGDVYIRASEQLGVIPEADVVCFGLWLDASVAKNHGVFVCPRNAPETLKKMLQKPSAEELNEVLQSNFYLTDIGIWLLSDRAVKALISQSGSGDQVKEYDLYSDFGRALGTHPDIDNPALRSLSVAIVPLKGGEFYHFGTSREMITSMLDIQNIVNDQRRIMHHGRKPHPSIFVQNSEYRTAASTANTNIWIENSCVPQSWTVSSDNVITGVPHNNWQISLAPGQCVDIVPVGATQWAVRTYNIDDSFAGQAQQQRRYPVVDCVSQIESALKEMLATGSAPQGLPLISAEEITAQANLERLFEQKRGFRRKNWEELAANFNHSVFYQLDLDHAASRFAQAGLPLPEPIPEHTQLITRIHDAMFRAQVCKLTGDLRQSKTHEDEAFNLLRTGLTEGTLAEKCQPALAVHSDQIVWGRSPVRIDIAGGWTDTPPFSLIEGGDVVNFAIELNGQQPLQTFIRPCPEPHIVLRSIDLGAAETVETYQQLADFNRVGSPFSIPKAALALAGFRPEFCAGSFHSLKEQLQDFGCGIELTMLSAIPAGSGLGTSSVLASTVLGAVSDFCSLCWDKNEIGRRTLVLEQMLTSGGGWQDQFGGVLHGVKLLHTRRGFDQDPLVRWLPDDIFTQPDYAACHLLYYTGITRTAKGILAEIVRRMFLNNGEQLRRLRQMKAHALDMCEAIQRHDFTRAGKLVGKTWLQNQAIDPGTNPPQVQAITRKVHDLCLGYKLPGAGGGGYLYMVAKDPDAAARIRQILKENPANSRARIVEMSLSKQGLQISRS